MQPHLAEFRVRSRTINVDIFVAIFIASRHTWARATKRRHSMVRQQLSTQQTGAGGERIFGCFRWGMAMISCMSKNKQCENHEKWNHYKSGSQKSIARCLLTRTVKCQVALLRSSIIIFFPILQNNFQKLCEKNSKITVVCLVELKFIFKDYSHQRKVSLSSTLFQFKSDVIQFAAWLKLL